MNRRGFLKMLAAAVAGFALDPERLLWRPGAKLISIPAPGGKLALPPYFISDEILASFDRSMREGRRLNNLFNPAYDLVAPYNRAVDRILRAPLWKY